MVRVSCWRQQLLLLLEKSAKNYSLKESIFPLEVKGSAEQSVVAFAREYNDTWSLTVVPRLVASLLELDGGIEVAQETPLERLLAADTWKDTTILLPLELPGQELVNAFRR